MTINLTIFVQIINFFIGYSIIRFFLLKPTVESIESDQKEEAVLKQAIIQNQVVLTKKKSEKEAVWQTCKSFLFEKQSILYKTLQKPLTISVEPLAAIQISDEQVDAFIKESTGEIIANLKKRFAHE